MESKENYNKILDEYIENMRDINNRREEFNKIKKYELARKQHIMEQKKIRITDMIKNIYPVVLGEISIFAILLCCTGLYKLDMDKKLHDTLVKYPNRPLSAYLRDEGLISDGNVFEYGNSENVMTNKQFLDKTDLGLYISQLGKKYGIDPAIFLAVLDNDCNFVENINNGEKNLKILADNLGDSFSGIDMNTGIVKTIEVSENNKNNIKSCLERRMILFQNNMHDIYLKLLSNYPKIYKDQINIATLMLSIQCQKYNMDSINYIIENVNLFDFEKKFSWFSFMREVEYIETHDSDFNLDIKDNEGSSYIKKIFNCLSEPELFFNYSGDSVEYFLDNDLQHLVWSPKYRSL